VFDERLVALKTGADEASDILRTSSDHLKERVVDIESASKSASQKMQDIAASISGQSSDIHLVTDQALAENRKHPEGHQRTVP
jgi:hypothetical protein